MKKTAVLFLISFFLFSCSLVERRVIEDQQEEVLSGEKFSEVRELVGSLKNRNSELKTFKGTGKLTFWERDNKSIATSIAWAGAAPDRFRLAIRNAMGQPLLSLSHDGAWLYYISHTENRFYKKHSDNSILEKFILIPVKFDDIISFLSGRLPVNKYDAASFINNFQNEHVIVLKNQRNIVEKIYLNENKDSFHKVEFFNEDGNLLYRAAMDKKREIMNYQIPVSLFFTDNNGNKLKIDIYKYWPNVSVESSVFVLRPE